MVRNCDSLLLLCCWGYFCIFVHLRLCCAILFARSRLALHWTTNEKKGKPLENPKKTCPTWIIFIQTQNSFRTICLRILQASWKQSHVSCISTWHENRLLLGGVVICFFRNYEIVFNEKWSFQFCNFFFFFWIFSKISIFFVIVWVFFSIYHFFFLIEVFYIITKKQMTWPFNAIVTKLCLLSWMI